MVEVKEIIEMVEHFNKNSYKIKVTQTYALFTLTESSTNSVWRMVLILDHMFVFVSLYDISQALMVMVDSNRNLLCDPVNLFIIYSVKLDFWNIFI